MHDDAMNDSTTKLHQTLAVLAPPRRFELLMLLLAGPDRSVSVLAEHVGLSQSCTSRHLQALERAGLVRGVRDGKRVVFRPAPRDEPAAKVLAALAGAGVPPPAIARRSEQTSRRRPAPGAGLAPARGRYTDPMTPSPAEFSADLVVSSDSELHHDRAPERAEPASGQAEPESGKNTTVTTMQRRWQSDLEDFLL
jgi:DNA-binding transcriptional ArsR family regulator